MLACQTIYGNKLLVRLNENCLIVGFLFDSKSADNIQFITSLPSTSYIT